MLFGELTLGSFFSYKNSGYIKQINNKYLDKNGIFQTYNAVKISKGDFIPVERLTYFEDEIEIEDWKD